jgi:dTMP kinase
VAELRAILRIRPFRRLWLVLGVASLGDWLGLLATATFAADQVHGGAAKGFAFGGVIAIRLLPALVLGPLAGVMADRWDRRYTMVVCDVLRFVLFASIPTVALFSDDATITVGWAAIATFIIESITLIWLPAKEAAVPNLIPKARLETSNQLTLVTTYGVTPVLASLFLAGLNQLYQTMSNAGVTVAAWADRPASRSISTRCPASRRRWSCSSASARSAGTTARATRPRACSGSLWRGGASLAVPGWSGGWSSESWAPSPPVAS